MYKHLHTVLTNSVEIWQNLKGPWWNQRNPDYNRLKDEGTEDSHARPDVESIIHKRTSLQPHRFRQRWRDLNWPSASSRGRRDLKCSLHHPAQQRLNPSAGAAQPADRNIIFTRRHRNVSHISRYKNIFKATLKTPTLLWRAFFLL